MDWVRKTEEWANAHRALALCGTALFLVVVAAVIFYCDPSLFKNLLYPDLDTVAQVRAWSARTYAAVLIAGLPIAFLIWHWRDRNMRDQISNARKDTNLKEFQEVQLRAAGGLDEKLPAEAREQLQIAGLHQLRGFLRGDYGKDFKRPAFELLLAGHAAAIFRIGVPTVQAQVAGKSPAQIADAATALRENLTPIDRSRMLIIRDEAEHIFTRAFPLYGRRFDLLDLSMKQFPEKLDLQFSHFFGADLRSANLEGANLCSAHLEGADLRLVHLESARLLKAYLECADLSFAHLERANLCGAQLEGAVLQWAHLEGADLSEAHLEGAKLFIAHLEGADLSDAHLEGADLSEAHLEGAILSWAHLDEATDCDGAMFSTETRFEDYFPDEWSDVTEDQRDAARAPWIARGMRHVDEIEPE